MLKITKAYEPITIEQLVVVVYSLPGIGKTTLAYTADKPLLLDFDKGSHRAKNRKDTVLIDSWDDVASLAREDLAPYNTLILDTAGRCLDVLTAHIINENPKNARGSGDLTLQGFGVLKAKFTSWLKLMKSYGIDVLPLAHMDERSEGDIVKERLDVQGGSKTEIYKSADAIGKLYIDGKIRKLDFSPREGSLGKNPGQLEILEVPDFRKDGEFLAKVIANIKGYINQLSETQRAEVVAVEAWKARIAQATDAAGFNALLPDARTASEVVKALVFAASKERGLGYDREAKQFYEKPIPGKAPGPITVSEVASWPEGEVMSTEMPLSHPHVPPVASEVQRLSKALQASIAKCDEAEVAKAAAALPQEWQGKAVAEMLGEPKRGRGRPPGAKNKPKEPEVVAAPPPESAKPKVLLFEAFLARLSAQTSKTGQEYQYCEFQLESGKRFLAYNYHHSLFQAMRAGIGAVMVFAAHERAAENPPVLYIDDIRKVGDVKYEGGQPVPAPKPVEELFA